MPPLVVENVLDSHRAFVRPEPLPPAGDEPAAGLTGTPRTAVVSLPLSPSNILAIAVRATPAPTSTPLPLRHLSALGAPTCAAVPQLTRTISSVRFRAISLQVCRDCAPGFVGFLRGESHNS